MKLENLTKEEFSYLKQIYLDDFENNDCIEDQNNNTIQHSLWDKNYFEKISAGYYRFTSRVPLLLFIKNVDTKVIDFLDILVEFCIVNKDKRDTKFPVNNANENIISYAIFTGRHLGIITDNQIYHRNPKEDIRINFPLGIANKSYKLKELKKQRKRNQWFRKYPSFFTKLWSWLTSLYGSIGLLLLIMSVIFYIY